MSELNVTPEELVEEIEYVVEDATVVTSPIDPTLTIPGEAADAKATGDRIAAVIGNLRLNGKQAVNNVIVLYAGDILMSSASGAVTIAEAIANANDRGADAIVYDAENLVTVKGALDTINEELESELSNEDIDGIFEEVFGGVE